ncbi:MAG: T9SS type A sorting domain-containing protein [Chitinophagales bacterium]|nr:T9SS type A sorting domain-containing protein [Chitinophagales bacterium]
MNRLAVLFLLLVSVVTSKASVIDSLILKRSYTKVQLDSVLNANGIPPFIIGTIYDIDIYKVSYHTASYDSTPVLASGMLAIPKNTSCRLPLASFAHGTETLRESVPSRIVGGEAVIGMVMASLGYAATLPDYIGLGDGPKNLLHPYQHALTEASATIDLLRAAREASTTAGFRLNGQLFLTGYSQGGHATMATHRTIQEQLAGEFTVTASCPMSGAYDMSGVMVDVMLSDSNYAVPGYLPYLVFSWNQKYQFYPNVSDYLAVPYDTLLPPLYNGNFGMGYINSKMPAVPKKIFKQSMIDSFTVNLNHPFRKALAENDVYNWTPTAPVRILFCRADEEVSWANSVKMINQFKANGVQNADTVCVNETLSHFQCAQFAILNMKDYFQSFVALDSCNVNAIEEVHQGIVNIYPNPANSSISIFMENDVRYNSIEAIDALGKVYVLPVQKGTKYVVSDVSSLANGLYSLRIANNKTYSVIGRINVQH